MMKQLLFNFADQPYTESEMSVWKDDTDFDPFYVPFWIWVKWAILGPPNSTGPR